jgi:hypothetical protein
MNVKTIVKILFTFSLLWIILIILSAVYHFGLLNNNNLKASYVQKSAIDATILFHGPCEPLWMISPKRMDKITGLKSYNLALSHSDFADNYLHLYLYLKNNKAPQFLFLFVTPESMDKQYNTFNTYRFAPFIGDAVVDNVLKECDNDYYKWTTIPFMQYAYYSNNINFNVLQGLKHYYYNDTIPYNADGYEPPFVMKWDNHLEKLIHLYPNGYHFKWDNLREKYLRKTIELAKKYHINVYLYESPILKEALPHQPNRDVTIARIKKLASEYDVNYIQFNNMKIAESRAYFMSTLNTTIKGSEIFMDTLGSYINQLVIAKQKQGF